MGRGGPMRLFIKHYGPGVTVTASKRYVAISRPQADRALRDFMDGIRDWSRVTTTNPPYAYSFQTWVIEENPEPEVNEWGEISP